MSNHKLGQELKLDIVVVDSQRLAADRRHVQQVVDLQLLVDTLPVLLHQLLLLLGQIIVFLFDGTSFLHIISSQTLPHLEEPGTGRSETALE